MVFSGIIFDDKRKKSWEKMNKISRTKKALHQHMGAVLSSSLFQDKASVRRNYVVVVFLLLVGVVVLLSTTKLALNNNVMSEDLNEVCTRLKEESVPSWSAKEALDASESIERKIRTGLALESTNVNEEEEGFTILLNTFKRRDLLRRSLRHYAKCKDSGRATVKEIRVVWSEQVSVPSAREGDDEKAYFLDRPEFVRYDKHVGSTSIQNRFEKIDDLKTEAVFHVDDDVRIPCGKLQKGFREWQRNREGLVGYFGRMHKLENRNGGVDGTCKMRYAWNDVELFFTSAKRYSIALTKAAFSHAKYLELYSSEHLPDGVREYIDARKNCEDIAMQMLVSSVVSEKNKREDGSLKRKKGRDRAAVTVSSGWMHYVAGKIDSVFVDGISSGQGHHDERSGCVTDFSRMFGGGSPLDV
jgi:hypothetical protein